MSNLNVVALTGRLTADPELRHTSNEIVVTTFRIAVDRPKYKGKEYELNKIIDARNEEGKNQYNSSEVSGHNDPKPEPSHATAKRIIYRGMYPNKSTL